MKLPPIRIILGPTASGKEKSALVIAERLNSDIISTDSMKIYKDMDIGTATPSKAHLEKIKHWAINIVEPSESFSVAQYLKYVEGTMKKLDEENKSYFFSGGTALYQKILTEGMLEGVGENKKLREKLMQEIEKFGNEYVHNKLEKLDQTAANKIHPNDIKRVIRAIEVVTDTGIPISEQQTQFGKQRTDRRLSLVGIHWDRAKLYARINQRVDVMIEKGLEEEACKLYTSSKPLSLQASLAVGYKEFFNYFDGKLTKDEAISLIKQKSRNLAKSQMTWFNKFDCQWIDADESTTPEEIAEKTIKLWDTYTKE